MSDPLAAGIIKMTVPPEELASLVLFIKNTCLVFLDAEEQHLSEDLAVEKYDDQYREFIIEPERSAILVIQQQGRVKLLFEVENLPTAGSAVVISKKKRVIYEPKSGPTKFSKLLNVLSLGELDSEYNPFELTQTYIQNTFLPLFNSLKNTSKEGRDKEGEDFKNLQTVKKKLSDLQLTLIRNNKLLEFSDMGLNQHPALKALVQEWTSQSYVLTNREDVPVKIPKELLNDTAFLNSLVTSVDELKEKATKFIDIYDKKSFDSLLEEVQFYELYTEKAAHLMQTLESNYLKAVVTILKRQKKVAATWDLETELGFANFFTTINEVAGPMREMKINDLLTSNTIESLRHAFTEVSSTIKDHLIKRNKPYPVNNYPNLLKAFNRDVVSQLVKLWREEKILEMTPDAFRTLHDATKEIFTNLEKFFRDCKSDLSTKFRSMNRTVLDSMNADCSALKNRLKKIELFKEKLQTVLSNIEEVRKNEVVYKEDKSLFITIDANEINLFSKTFEGVDFLNLSREGDDQVLKATEQNKRLHDDFEQRVVDKIIEKLGLAQNDEEMFRIYSCYYPFLSKTTGQTSSIKFKDTLTKQLDGGFEELKQKMENTKYESSNSRYISEFYDIPMMTGTFLWNKQILSKMKTNMDRKIKIVGEQSSQSLRQSKQVFEEFQDRKKNEETNTVNKFITEYGNEKELISKVTLFAVREKWGSNKDYEIVSNFNDKLIEKFKDMRNIIKQTEGLDYMLRYHFKTDWALFKHACYLKEILALYNYLSSRIDEKMTKLLASNLKDIQEYIKSCASCTWMVGNSASGVSTTAAKNLENIIKNLASKVNSLEKGYNDLVQRREQIDGILDYLETCEIDSKVFTDKIKEIQTILNDLKYNNYSNIHTLVSDLQGSVEKVLKKRLTDIIQQWCLEFEEYKNRDIERKLIKESTVHEIKIQNRIIFVDPPIEYATTFWFSHFHACTGMICNLPKLDSSFYSTVAKLGKEKKSTHASFYHNLIFEIDQSMLNNAYSRIRKVVGDAEKYARTWLCYQGLWELEFSEVQKYLKDDINSWQKILNDIKSGRSIFDNSETELFFGAIRVNYRVAQGKITANYDQWHKEILNQFGKTLNENLNQFFGKIKNARERLEKIDFSRGENTVAAISDLNYCKENIPKWSANLQHFKDGQKLLEVQRFHFPNNWTFSDQIDGDWVVVKQIFAKKSEDYDRMFEELKVKLEIEDKAIRSKMEEINKVWEEKRPFDGSLTSKEALEVLAIIDTKLAEMGKRYEEMNTAKKLMELIPSDTSGYENKKEEVDGLKEVWNDIAKVWKKIDSMADSTLPACQPTKMIREIDGVVDEMNALPNRYKSYEAFNTKKEHIKSLKKQTIIINNLKSETFKERHWRELLKKMGIKKSQSDLTIGELWRIDLNKHSKTIEVLVAQAAGEFVLEDMIRKIKEYWQNFELELVRYQNKGKLIRGWDDLFNKVDEDLGNLSSMKLSPHFKSFEEEINPWTEKLQKIRIIFDIWIDVQRKWVYLEGIFFGSGEIKVQLANDYNRFKGIDNEFTGLMKKVSAKPKMLEVLTIGDLQRTLERLNDSLDKIQKALTDYLETQRQAFARFYFVGDEDLLEIIGNSKDVINIQKHFPKMFAGISTITNENNGDILKGMCSKEDERVGFVKNVTISEDSKIDVWLKKMENQMKVSLGAELEKCTKQVSGVSDIESKEKFGILRDSINGHPCQVVVLAFQILWTELIEDALEKGLKVSNVVNRVVQFLGYLAEEVLSDLEKSLRQKYEQLITESVHQRDVARILEEQNVTSNKDFKWQYYMRFYFNPKENDILKKLVIKMGNANFCYGFEYLGMSEKLVQTPLTDKCYLTLTQALSLRMGGAPFGPAGTGKTESVKMLGSQLGNFVLVFNCDEAFNFKAMGRIFIGLCQVGAWGCFDEFNRLEERILSAVSQQILTIQTGLREKTSKIELMGRDVKLNPDMGIFVTMNPGYAGRSNLPENLKQLFRQMAMVTPDKELIGQVMLFSQGFKSAEKLAGKIVSLFELCNYQLSSQPHYDFGLRSLKAVLNSAGSLKRAQTREESMPLEIFEQNILLRSLCDTVVPKLVAEDTPLLSNLLLGVFPRCRHPQAEGRQASGRFEGRVQQKIPAPNRQVHREVHAAQRHPEAPAWCDGRRTIRLRKKCRLEGSP